MLVPQPSGWCRIQCGRPTSTLPCMCQASPHAYVHWGEPFNARDGILNRVRDPQASRSVIVPFSPGQVPEPGALQRRFDIIVAAWIPCCRPAFPEDEPNVCLSTAHWMFLKGRASPGLPTVGCRRHHHCGWSASRSLDVRVLKNSSTLCGSLAIHQSTRTAAASPITCRDVSTVCLWLG
jgi:hypothetical protein